MKKCFFVALLALTVCATLVFASQARASEFEDDAEIPGFLSKKEIKEHIEEYFKENVPNRMIIQLYLLEINKAGITSNEMWVYFLEGRSPDTAKDFYGNISSRRETILLAKFSYDYLKGAWRISTIEKFEGEKIFKVDD